MGDDLQFDRADYGQAAEAGTPCAGCKRALRDRYFEINGKRICEPCRASFRWPPGTPLARVGRALARSAPWVVAGAVVHFVCARYLGIELALVTVFIGFFVGRAVKVGSYGAGGVAYQALAMALTYLSITCAYYALLLDSISQLGKHLTGEGYLRLVPIAVEFPFLRGAENILGILIIGFGLYQAWKLNKRFDVKIAGPFELANAAG